MSTIDLALNTPNKDVELLHFITFLVAFSSSKFSCIGLAAIITRNIISRGDFEVNSGESVHERIKGTLGQCK